MTVRNIRLSVLEARLYRRVPGSESVSEEVHSIAEAEYVMFLCPKCFDANGGAVGTHMIACWRPGAGWPGKDMGGHWNLEGTSLADLTLTGGSASVLVTGTGSCGAHFFVRNGSIIPC